MLPSDAATAISMLSDPSQDRCGNVVLLLVQTLTVRDVCCLQILHKTDVKCYSAASTDLDSKSCVLSSDSSQD